VKLPSIFDIDMIIRTWPASWPLRLRTGPAVRYCSYTHSLRGPRTLLSGVVRLQLETYAPVG